MRSDKRIRLWFRGVSLATACTLMLARIALAGAVADTVEPILWDTVATHEVFDGGSLPVWPCFGLIVSNHGEAGHAGLGGVNLDFAVSGLECGTRHADSVYLSSGSPFLIENRDGELVLTTSVNRLTRESVNSWTPVVTSQGMAGGLSADGSYDSVYTGVFVNRDSTIGMERRYYAPRDYLPIFVIVGTSIFAFDGEPHSSLTVGTVTDWDIPSDSIGINRSWVSPPLNTGISCLFMQGTDTAGGQACWPGGARAGVESPLGWYHTAELGIDPCINHGGFWGTWAGSASFLRDTSLSRLGQPLDPPQLDASAWLEDVSDHPGLVADSVREDQAIWLTFQLDGELAAEDTLVLWTAYTSYMSGNYCYLAEVLFKARRWYKERLRGCDPGCCLGYLGDANGTGGWPTISDISVMIDMLYISGTEVACLSGADANRSGGCNPTRADITIGDIATLISVLFIGEEPDCFLCLDCP